MIIVSACPFCIFAPPFPALDLLPDALLLLLAAPVECNSYQANRKPNSGYDFKRKGNGEAPSDPPKHPDSDSPTDCVTDSYCNNIDNKSDDFHLLFLLCSCLFLCPGSLPCLPLLLFPLKEFPLCVFYNVFPVISWHGGFTSHSSCPLNVIGHSSGLLPIPVPVHGLVLLACPCPGPVFPKPADAKQYVFHNTSSYPFFLSLLLLCDSRFRLVAQSAQ